MFRGVIVFLTDTGSLFCSHDRPWTINNELCFYLWMIQNVLGMLNWILIIFVSINEYRNVILNEIFEIELKTIQYYYIMLLWTNYY